MTRHAAHQDFYTQGDVIFALYIRFVMKYGVETSKIVLVEKDPCEKTKELDKDKNITYMPKEKYR